MGRYDVLLEQEKTKGTTPSTTWIASPDRRRLLFSRDPWVMVVTQTPQRRDELRNWTERELHALGLFMTQGHIFAITCASPVAMSPQEFFTEPHWYPAYEADPDSLIDLPDEACH